VILEPLQCRAATVSILKRLKTIATEVTASAIPKIHDQPTAAKPPVW
jgi:hypothetical protein